MTDTQNITSDPQRIIARLLAACDRAVASIARLAADLDTPPLADPTGRHGLIPASSLAYVNWPVTPIHGRRCLVAQTDPGDDEYPYRVILIGDTDPEGRDAKLRWVHDVTLTP